LIHFSGKTPTPSGVNLNWASAGSTMSRLARPTNPMSNATDQEHSNETNRNLLRFGWLERHRQRGVLLGRLHDHLPALRDRAGGLYGDLQMTNDDDNEDMIFSFVFVAVTILTVLFAVAGAALVVWSFL
jgi:hypothetical protein